MSDVELTAQYRDEFGKGAARRIRRENKIPAVLYGHGVDPIHLTLPGHETTLALRQANVLLSLTIDDEEPRLALPRQVQRHPFRDYVEHIDLILVKRGEKVSVEVPIILEGEPESETVVNQDRTFITVLADATRIPTEYVVSIEGMELGSQILASDIDLDGAELDDEPDTLILSINRALSEEELEAELVGAGEEDEELVDVVEGEEGEEGEAAEGEEGEAADEQ